MAEFAGDILPEQPVKQRQKRHQRQRPADRPACRFEHHDEQNNSDHDLEIAFKKAVLVAKRRMLPSNPDARRHAKRAKHNAGPAACLATLGEQENPGQGQRQMQRPADQIGNQPPEDKAQMKCHQTGGAGDHGHSHPTGSRSIC